MQLPRLTFFTTENPEVFQDFCKNRADRVAESREVEEGCTQQPSPSGVVPVRHSAEAKLREAEMQCMNWEVSWP